MEVLRKGREQRGWSIEKDCTGAGNGGGGCGAKLLVSEFDIYETILHPSCLDDSGPTYCRTFTCPACGVETDFKTAEIPGMLWERTGRKKPSQSQTTTPPT